MVEDETEARVSELESVLELVRERLAGRSDFYGLWKRVDDVLEERSLNAHEVRK